MSIKRTKTLDKIFLPKSNKLKLFSKKLKEKSVQNGFTTAIYCILFQLTVQLIKLGIDHKMLRNALRVLKKGILEKIVK